MKTYTSIPTLSVVLVLASSVSYGVKPPEDAPIIDADQSQGQLSQKEMWETPGPTTGQERTGRTEQAPKQLDGVGVVEKTGEQIPLGLEFKNSAGEAVTLGDVISGDRPVLLTLNYSNCPMLCSLMLNGLVDGLEDMEWTIGEQFEVITVSLDPAESPDRALSTKERFLSDYGRDIDSGWTFLVGEEKNIRALADSVGFGYRYSETRKEYLHAAAVMLLTPEAKVSRYLYGINYSPKTIRLSLAEASDGKFASTIDQLILFCFHFDETEGRYAPVARRIMMLGGALTVLLLGLFLGGFWAKEAWRHES